MGEPADESDLDALYDQLEPFDFQAHIDELQSLGDSAHVLVAAALVDELLEILFLHHLTNTPNKLVERLFSGPLSSFSAKIDVAYALNLIEHEIHSDLRAVAAIRNAFAHTKALLHFSSPEVTRLSCKFKGWFSGGDARAIFFERINRAVNAIKAKTDALVYANAVSNKPMTDRPQHSP